jgi:hypothetical protein
MFAAFLRHPILAAKSKTYIFVVAVSIRVEESRFVYFLQK